jgi:hypothetical protein
MQGQERNEGHVQQNDPIQRVVVDSPRLAASWLKGGKSLTPVQRVGHGLISVAYLSAGAFLAGGAKDNFEAMDSSIFIGLCFSIASLFFFFFGGIGLRNVLRFKGRE